MVKPLSYIKGCLANEFWRLMNEWIAVKIACFLTLLSCLFRIDTLIFFFTFSKWYGPTNYSPYLSCTFKETIAPLEPSLSATSIELLQSTTKIQMEWRQSYHLVSRAKVLHEINVSSSFIFVCVVFNSLLFIIIMIVLLF